GQRIPGLWALLAKFHGSTFDGKGLDADSKLLLEILTREVPHLIDEDAVLDAKEPVPSEPKDKNEEAKPALTDGPPIAKLTSEEARQKAGENVEMIWHSIKEDWVPNKVLDAVFNLLVDRQTELLQGIDWPDSKSTENLRRLYINAGLS